MKQAIFLGRLCILYKIRIASLSLGTLAGETDKNHQTLPKKSQEPVSRGCKKRFIVIKSTISVLFCAKK